MHDCILIKYRGLSESISINTTISEERKNKLNKALLIDLINIQHLHVDGSILKHTGIVKTMQKIISNISKTISSECIEIANNLISTWKKQIKNDYSVNTLTSIRGGHVLSMPKCIEDIEQPKQISLLLWNQLKSIYNLSQLFAIKYVSDQFEGGQDTRVALIQGPPGYILIFYYIEIKLFMIFLLNASASIIVINHFI